MTKSSAWLLATIVVLGCGRTASRRAEGAFIAVKGFDDMGGGVRLEEATPGVKVLVWLENAPPGAKDVRVKERGDCSEPLVESTGKHLGSLTIRDDGMGYLELTTNGNLKPNDPLSLRNKAIVIHQSDDEGPQPAGDPEKPLACAVIKAS